MATPAGAERIVATAPKRQQSPASAERFTTPRQSPAQAERKKFGYKDDKHEREYVRRKFTGRR